jgi:hypothetical protein
MPFDDLQFGSPLEVGVQREGEQQAAVAVTDLAALQQPEDRAEIVLVTHVAGGRARPFLPSSLDRLVRQLVDRSRLNPDRGADNVLDRSIKHAARQQVLTLEPVRAIGERPQRFAVLVQHLPLVEVAPRPRRIEPAAVRAADGSAKRRAVLPRHRLARDPVILRLGVGAGDHRVGAGAADIVGDAG